MTTQLTLFLTDHLSIEGYGFWSFIFKIWALPLKIAEELLTKYCLTSIAPDRCSISSTSQAEKFNRPLWGYFSGERERKNKESNGHMEQCEHKMIKRHYLLYNLISICNKIGKAQRRKWDHRSRKKAIHKKIIMLSISIYIKANKPRKKIKMKRSMLVILWVNKNNHCKSYKSECSPFFSLITGILLQLPLAGAPFGVPALPLYMLADLLLSKIQFLFLPSH